MKPILVEDFIKDYQETQTETKVTIDGKTYIGWQIAKPLNFEPEYFDMKDREEMANAILEGKAIAVRFFSDLSEKEQQEYVKLKIKP